MGFSLDIMPSRTIKHHYINRDASKKVPHIQAKITKYKKMHENIFTVLSQSQESYLP